MFDYLQDFQGFLRQKSKLVRNHVRSVQHKMTSNYAYSNYNKLQTSMTTSNPDYSNNFQNPRSNKRRAELNVIYSASYEAVKMRSIEKEREMMTTKHPKL